MKRTLLLLTAASLALVMASCNKKPDTQPEPKPATMEDSVRQEMTAKVEALSVDEVVKTALREAVKSITVYEPRTKTTLKINKGKVIEGDGDKPLYPDLYMYEQLSPSALFSYHYEEQDAKGELETYGQLYYLKDEDERKNVLKAIRGIRALMEAKGDKEIAKTT